MITDTQIQINTAGGHFLKEDISAFDAPFFGIHPVEASVSHTEEFR
jgi:acyl transferase domain-containing protein